MLYTVLRYSLKTIQGLLRFLHFLRNLLYLKLVAGPESKIELPWILDKRLKIPNFMFIYILSFANLKHNWKMSQRSCVLDFKYFFLSHYVLIVANIQCFWTGKYNNITNCLVQWILTWNFNFDLNLIFKLNFWETKYYCSFDSNKVAIFGDKFQFSWTFETDRLHVQTISLENFSLKQNTSLFSLSKS